MNANPVDGRGEKKKIGREKRKKIARVKRAPLREGRWETRGGRGGKGVGGGETLPPVHPSIIY